MRGDPREIFKIMEFLIMVDSFSIFLFTLEIYCQDRFQKLNLLTNQIFFANRVIYFGNKLPNQIKNSSSVKHFKIKLDDFRNNGKKKN